MKRLLCLGGLIIAASSQATLFGTTVFTTQDNFGASPNLSPTYVTSGNTYTANFVNHIVSAGTWLDVTWWHTFDASVATTNSSVSVPYQSVTQTMTGMIRQKFQAGAATFTASLTETTLNPNGGSVGNSNPVFNFNEVVGTNWTPFSFSSTTNFSPALMAGTSQKDNLILNNADQDVEIVITSISQNYTPVPEPATLAVVGLGVAAIARRRKLK